MGLFDKVLGGGSDTIDAKDAFTGVCLCAVAADGEIAPEEIQGMFTALARMKLYEGVNERQFRASIDKWNRSMKEKGFDATVDNFAAAVPGELRQTAFVVAADLLLADGHVAAKEKSFLERIQKALGVNDDLALKSVEIISIKNRG